MADPSTDVIKNLREEDARCREWFLDVLKHHHPELTSKLQEVIKLAEKWTKSNDEDDFNELEDFLESLMPNETILVRARWLCHARAP